MDYKIKIKREYDSWLIEVRDKCKSKGYSTRFIGKELGITGQAVWQKLAGKHPFTAIEKEVLTQFLNK
jgi:hypothetical protein